jgi:hypothetical protein
MGISNKRGPTKKAFAQAEPDSPFYLHCKLPDEDIPEAMKNYMLSEDNIRDVIRSRDEVDPAGSDRISYRIMKAGGPEAIKFMTCITKATIRSRRMVESWKEVRMIPIYKKADREDLKNKRPITTPNCLYRIYTCLMARSFQQMNLQYGIYIDAQKGFIIKGS